MDPELAAALTMFDEGDPTDLERDRLRLRRLYETNRPRIPRGVRVRDVAPQANDRPLVRMRVYEPVDSLRATPALMWIHGGAFSHGFPELDDDLCLRLCADAGFLIVSPDYRLSPEDPFPAGFDDCYETLLWLVKRADLLGIDASCIAVGGSSAGGALAAGVCLRARDEAGPVIRHQILACPVIDDRLDTASMVRYASAPIFNRDAAELMWKRYLGGAMNTPRYAAPGREQDLSNLPPAFILTADCDPLRDEGIAFATRLIASGNQVELHHVPNTFHSFDSIVPTAGVSQRVYHDYVAALRRCRTD